MLTVADIMTRELYTLTPGNTLLDARKLMAEKNIRHIPIVSSERALIGIVSQRDVLAAADSSVFSIQSGNDPREFYVELASVMTSPVQTVEEHASLRGTALYLQKYHVGCLPVVRNNQLVGIITDADFVAVAINLMEQLEDVEPLDQELGGLSGEDAL